MAQIKLGTQVEAMVTNLRAQDIIFGVDGECILNGIPYATKAYKVGKVIRIEVTEIE